MVLMSIANLVFEMFALTFCGIVAATATVFALLLIEYMWSRVPRVKPKPIEPIMVHESPMPTRTQSTPRDSPPIERTKAKARRAGTRRYPMHRRASTEVYNPKIDGGLWVRGSHVGCGNHPYKA